MKKKVVGGLITGFSILLLLVILSFFIDFKAFSQVIYIIFLIAKSIFGIIRNKRIDKMYHKINEIDEKLNLLIKKSPRILKKRLLSSQIKSNKNQKNKH